MTDAVDLCSDVVTGATALAGLFLVYLGNVTAAFSTFEKTQQATVRGAHQVRAWLAFVGMLFAIFSAVLALVGKWCASNFVAGDAVILLIGALGWGAAIGLRAARDVR